ncbi:sigma factor-like helix-turn-helix DNA-binding protein [Microcoleus sp. OTE_8_concoct_300]|uniref:sigma factor-like helix-turn-helix DNA-binding protein n=1 Tax=Microcoleus sp. OTE_8_concoct_300 TaxID=2964710 RepID=UPI00403FBBCB
MPNPFNQEIIPRLPERRDNAENFFTYLILTTCNRRPVIQWQNDAELKRNFELYQECNPTFSQLCSQPNPTKNVAEFWRQIAINPSLSVQDWEPDNRKMLALKHLASYFEKGCYYAAIEVGSKSSALSWEEYLYCARVFICNSENFIKLLQSYNVSHQASLDTYIQQILIKTIQASISKFSRWRLLTHESDKYLREALQRAGTQEPNISQFIFARKYFKQVYRFNKVNNPAIRQPGQKWPNADSEDFQAAAECYNAEKYLSSAPHEVSAGSSISGEQMQAWMKICIAALQNYPKSINPQYSIEALQEQGYDGFLDKSQLENANIAKAKNYGTAVRELHNQTDSAFRKQLENLKPDQHKILLLYYGAGFKQKQLALQLNLNQSSISRRLDAIKIQLLQAMVEMSQPHQWVADYVVEWLQKKFRAPLHSDLIQVALVQAIKELESEEQEVLHLRYGQQVAEEKIATELGVDLLAVSAIISQAQQKLQANLIKVLNTWVNQYVEKWLVNFYEAAGQTLNLSLGSKDTSKTIDTMVQECLQTLMIGQKGE